MALEDQAIPLAGLLIAAVLVYATFGLKKETKVLGDHTATLAQHTAGLHEATRAMEDSSALMARIEQRRFEHDWLAQRRDVLDLRIAVGTAIVRDIFGYRENFEQAIRTADRDLVPYVKIRNMVATLTPEEVGGNKVHWDVVRANIDAVELGKKGGTDNVEQFRKAYENVVAWIGREITGWMQERNAINEGFATRPAPLSQDARQAKASQ